MTRQIHPRTEIGHVRLRVSDLERSVRFYTDVIGFQVLERQERTASFTADGANPLLQLEEVPDAVIQPRRSVSGLYHFAILVPDREALELSLRSLAQHGIRVGSSDHLVSEALYINDPDLNGIEIYRDRPRDSWTVDEQGEYRMAVDPLDLQALLDEAGDRPWSGLPAETKIGHVHFHVPDLQKARDFYCGVLGFDVTAHYGNEALFVSAGGYHHHIGLNTWAGVGAPSAPPKAPGIDYFSLLLPNEEAVNHVLTRLREAGFAAETHAPSAWLLRDPFGVGILLTITTTTTTQ